MARNSKWSDEYWLLLMQVYLRKPVGVKPLYSKPVIDLAMELHIAPQLLYEQMFRLRQLDTPRIEQLWKTYGNNPKKLRREVDLLRQMNGYGNAGVFYDGVEVNETWEKDFKPISEDIALKPVGLILILDLYFRLTPITMVAETPEIIELAKRLKVKPRLVVEVMEIYQWCDPYLNREDMIISPLSVPCQQVWQRFGNEAPENLSALAAQMREYYAG